MNYRIRVVTRSCRYNNSWWYIFIILPLLNTHTHVSHTHSEQVWNENAYTCACASVRIGIVLSMIRFFFFWISVHARLDAHVQRTSGGTHTSWCRYSDDARCTDIIITCRSQQKVFDATRDSIEKSYFPSSSVVGGANRLKKVIKSCQTSRPPDYYATDELGANPVRSVVYARTPRYYKQLSGLKRSMS